jgi:hypothetical protein
MSTGHFDSVSFANCGIGIDLQVNSRANYSYSSFSNCDVGVRINSGSVAYEQGAVFDLSGQDIVTGAYGVLESDNPYVTSGIATDFLETSPDSKVTVTNTLNSVVCLSKTLPKGKFAPILGSTRKPMMIKFRAFGTYSGFLSNRQFKFRLGTTSLAGVTVGTSGLSTSGHWVAEGHIVFTGQSAQVSNMLVTPFSGSPYVNIFSSTVAMNTTTDTSLTFEIQHSAANSDTTVVNHAHFEVWG